jgi:hypothetical protein
MFFNGYFITYDIVKWFDGELNLLNFKHIYHF